MSDPECYQFFAHPRVSETEIVKETREGDESGSGSGSGSEGLPLPLGMEVLEAALTMRARGLMGACYCFPVEVRCEGLGLGRFLLVVASSSFAGSHLSIISPCIYLYPSHFLTPPLTPARITPYRSGGSR